MRFRPLAAVLLPLASLAAPAFAQPAAEHRYEVTLVFGASLLSADGIASSPFPVDSLQPLEVFLPPGTIRRLLPSTIETRDHLGASFLQGFQVSRRLARRGWIEAEFLIAPAHTRRRSASFRCPAEVCALLGLSSASLDDALSGEERVTAYHYGLGFAYELAQGDVRPFLSVGAGAVTYDVPRGGGTSFAFEFGAGARLSFGERVGGRIEVADRVIPDHFLSGATEHDVQVRAGAVFRLP